jgi:kynurenine formamidase
MPRVSFFPKPVFKRFLSQPERVLNVTKMEMVVHMGTHIDSPRHFFLDGPALEDVPLERTTGRGVIWPVKVEPCGLIEPAHFKGLEDLLLEGDILILNSGWHLHLGTPDYESTHPSLSEAAAHWLVSHKVKLVGFDFATPDLAVPRRPPNFDYPIHRILLANGVLIAEHLTNLSALSGEVVEVITAGLNIVGGDGAPARIMARRLEVA